MQYTIKSIGSLLGIKPDTLRKWEMRYDFLSPRRTGNRYRHYDDEDLTRIAKFQELCGKGMTAHWAAEAAAKYHPGNADLEKRIKTEAWKAIETLDRDGLERLFKALLRSQGLVQSFNNVWVPLLEKLGDCGVSKQQIWIAKEHFSVACLREFVLRLSKRQPRSSKPVIALAAPEGDYHELGIIVSSIALSQRGISSLFLGANLPTQSLCDLLKKTRVRHLCLTMTNPVGRAQFKRMRSKLRDAIPKVSLYFAGQATLPLAKLISESGSVFLGTHAEIGMDILVKKMGRK